VVSAADRRRLTTTLTVEPEFKSTAEMGTREDVDADDLITIGELARRAGVATSAVRYYERRGLLVADERRSGQRRYTAGSQRLLIFIGMLQDAGLSLDDIEGILAAGSVTEWKAIAKRRLDALDEEIERLEHARTYLAGALLCRYDHPATECKVMGAEIDRRLADHP
jgi:DNA-binding transcriptional MerR regulator